MAEAYQNLNNWTKNMSSFPTFNNIYDEETNTNTLTYKGGGGYERIYYPITLQFLESVTFSVSFCTPSGYSCSYGDSQEYFAIGTTTGSTGSISGISSLESTPITNSSASEDYVTYRVSYRCISSSGVTAYLIIDFGYMVDGTTVTLKYKDIKVTNEFSSDWQMEEDYPYLINQPQDVLTTLDINSGSVPDSLMRCEDDYPYLINQELIKLTPNYPISMWVQEESYPYIQNTDIISYTPDYPFTIMIQEVNSYPKIYGNTLEFMGAFKHSSNLIRIKIPKSVTSLGKYTFMYSPLLQVELPEDCSYYTTTFPPDCVITGGKLID